MKQRIDDMEAGTWFRSGDSVFVRLSGAVLQGNSTFQAVNLYTGTPACPCGTGCSPQLSQIEYEVMEQPNLVVPAEGSLKFDTAERRDAAWRSIQKDHPHVSGQLVEDQDGFFIKFTTTRGICELIELRYGR